MAKNNNNKLKIGIYELTGCAGDALLILDCEKELVDIFQAADIQSFLMAKSDNIDGELDIAFVDGSQCSPPQNLVFFRCLYSHDRDFLIIELAFAGPGS